MMRKCSLHSRFYEVMVGEQIVEIVWTVVVVNASTQHRVTGLHVNGVSVHHCDRMRKRIRFDDGRWRGMTSCRWSCVVQSWRRSGVNDSCSRRPDVALAVCVTCTNWYGNDSIWQMVTAEVLLMSNRCFLSVLWLAVTTNDDRGHNMFRIYVTYMHIAQLGKRSAGNVVETTKKRHL